MIVFLNVRREKARFDTFIGRVFEVWGYFWRSSAPTPLLKQRWMLRTMPKQLLYISKVWDCSAPLNTPCQWSVILTMFPDIQKELPVFQSVPSASGPVSGYHCKGPGSIFACYLKIFTWMKSLLNLHSSRLRSTISLPIYVSCSKPLTTFVTLLRTESSMSMSLLYWGNQDRTQQSRCDSHLHCIQSQNMCLLVFLAEYL